MAELEIHHEAEHRIDPTGQKVGILAAVLAVLLAITTIASHRTHTAAVVHQTEANDQWQHYQSTRVKFHLLELGEDLLVALGDKRPGLPEFLAKYRRDKERYQKQREEIQAEARAKEQEARHAEDKALGFDFGEGLLEIGLVLTSLFFISRKKLFPAMGVVAGVAGAGIAVIGFLR